MAGSSRGGIVDQPTIFAYTHSSYPCHTTQQLFHAMELIVSIVSWNTKDLLRTCLTSLLRYSKRDHTRIVVVDNASKDGTPAMIRSEFPEVELIESGGNLGFGKANNLVQRISNEPFVLFLNPDTELVEPAFEQMLDVFKQHPQVGLVGCRMTNLDGSIQPLGIQWHTNPWSELLSGLLLSRATISLAGRLLPYHDPTRSGFVRKLYGGCLMVRREVLEKTGWFDERFFMYGEDVDLSRRVEAAGWSLYYLSSARIIHLCGGASAKAPGRFSILMQCESIEKLMMKYYGHTGAWLYRSAIFARGAFRLILLGLAWLPLRLATPARHVAWRNSWLKQSTLLKWSVGLARPSIPK